MLLGIDNPVLIHYGSFEATFLKKMCDRYGAPPEDSNAANAIASSINLLSVIFAQVYFPAYSNGLKEIARFLGFGIGPTDPPPAFNPSFGVPGGKNLMLRPLRRS